MTTQRRRRNKQQQASDALRALLHDQEVALARSYAKYRDDLVAIGKTRRALEVWDESQPPNDMAEAELAEGVLRPLPSSLTSSTHNEVETQLVQSNVGVLEDEPTPLAYVCICRYNPATGYRLDIVCPVHDGVNTGHLPLDNRAVQTDVSVSRPHRQRIGEEAQQLLNDVWNPKDGNSVTVHSRLMYSRQESCELCRAGVPFATEKRTQHRVVPSDEAKAKWGVEHRPCTGIEKVA